MKLFYVKIFQHNAKADLYYFGEHEKNFLM